MSSVLVTVAAFAVLFVLAGWLRLRIECTDDGDCRHCGGGSCTLKRKRHDSP